MAEHLTCDLCDKALLVDEDARYEVRIQVYAAYDPLELTPDDLAQDTADQIRRLVAQLEGMDPQEVEDSVYKEFLFDLCPDCQRRYIRDPLPRHPEDKADDEPRAG
jgi:hypothetical protein